MRALAWALNFDAEVELEIGAGYTPSAAMAARARALVAKLPLLVEAGDVVLDLEAPARNAARDFRGIAWCPTPRALAAIRASGAIVPDAPAFDVLRRANDRAFSAALGATLPGEAFHRDSSAALAHLREPSPTNAWLAKRAFGFAGRGRLVVRASAVDETVERWIASALRRGDGVQIEPLVDRVADYALHGFLRTGGDVVLGAPTRLWCDESGAWIRTTRAANGDLSRAERVALEDAARLVATALHTIGYWGPYNIDAFRWRDRNGAFHLRSRSESNARFSMGWGVGMAEFRPHRGDKRAR